ncbi:PREDICTED: uncharacterized protein LOC101820816 [Ficedula albicollis]|uniref:uncharacterized protein LOC101820816 n=1 Tax=Ficedula albicollis TaxID=59894 RepID=UPI000359A37B|nr:PREDICTED: uncharacterized protein LOC101820816 [Ficedula albicollis]
MSSLPRGAARRAGARGRCPCRPSGRDPRADPRCPFPALSAPFPAPLPGPSRTPPGPSAPQHLSPSQTCAWFAGGNAQSVGEWREHPPRGSPSTMDMEFPVGMIPQKPPCGGTWAGGSSSGEQRFVAAGHTITETLLDNALGLVLHWETHPGAAGSIPSPSVSIKGKHLRCSSRAVLEKIPLSSRQTTSTGVRTSKMSAEQKHSE